MNETLIRAISGLVYITILIASIYISQLTFSITLFVFAAITCWEFNKLIQEKSAIPYFQLIIVFGILWFSDAVVLQQTFIPLAILSLIYQSILAKKLFTLQAVKKPSFLTHTLPLTYVITPMALISLIPAVMGSYDPNIIMGILIIIWSNDTFAYLVGRSFGKRKLFPKISPKKTIEGFLGGALFGVITSIIIALVLCKQLSLLNWIILSLGIAILGTIGDLVASKFKREANSKDSSNLIPGHGGFLDRLDSLIFVASFVYLYFQIINYVS